MIFLLFRELVLLVKMSDPAVQAAPEVAGTWFSFVWNVDPPWHSHFLAPLLRLFHFSASEPTKPSKPTKAPPLDPRLKQIKIKTGVLKRVGDKKIEFQHLRFYYIEHILKVGKEKLSYRKEADMQKAKLDKMKEEGKDEHDVKKMGEVALMHFLV